MSFRSKLTELSAEELMERRNSALERRDMHEQREQTYRHLERCWRPGLDLLGVVRAELNDCRAEQQRAREDLAHVERELDRRLGAQLPLFASAAGEAA